MLYDIFFYHTNYTSRVVAECEYLIPALKVFNVLNCTLRWSRADTETSNNNESSEFAVKSPTRR